MDTKAMLRKMDEAEKRNRAAVASQARLAEIEYRLEHPLTAMDRKVADARKMHDLMRRIGPLYEVTPWQRSVDILTAFALIWRERKTARSWA